MAACEKCWTDAHGILGAYLALLKIRCGNKACTPREQAGQFWNEEAQRDSRETPKPPEKPCEQERAFEMRDHELRVRIQHLTFEKDRLCKRHRQSLDEINAHMQNCRESLERYARERAKP